MIIKFLNVKKTLKYILTYFKNNIVDLRKYILKNY